MNINKKNFLSESNLNQNFNNNNHNLNSNFNTEFDTNINSDSNSDSDSYIDLSECVRDDLKHIFQFHLMDTKLIIKHIGKSSDTPDIIIMENFGPESNMSLYNCVYSHDELETTKISNDININVNMDKNINKNNKNNEFNNLDLFFPIVKLIIKTTSSYYTITSLAIKLNQQIVIEQEINEWDLYWIENFSFNKEAFKTIKLEKNVNPSNILEKLIELSINK